MTENINNWKPKYTNCSSLGICGEQIFVRMCTENPPDSEFKYEYVVFPFFTRQVLYSCYSLDEDKDKNFFHQQISLEFWSVIGDTNPNCYRLNNSDKNKKDEIKSLAHNLYLIAQKNLEKANEDIWLNSDLTKTKRQTKGY